MIPAALGRVRLVLLGSAMGLLALGCGQQGGGEGGSAEKGSGSESAGGGEGGSAEKGSGSESAGGGGGAQNESGGDEASAESGSGEESSGASDQGGGSGKPLPEEAKKLVGTWTVDLEATKKMGAFDNVPKGQEKRVPQMKRALEQATFEFTESELTTTMMGRERTNGFEVDEVTNDGQDIVLRNTEGKGDPLKASFRSEDRMVFGPGDEKRKKGPMSNLVLVRDEGGGSDSGGSAKGDPGQGASGGDSGSTKGSSDE